MVGKEVMKTLRLILGDQLDINHSWFDQINKNIIYFMAEMRQETDYTNHHIQKITAFFIAMRSFADTLIKSGHQVIYYKLDNPDNQQDLCRNLKKIIQAQNINMLQYQNPDEHRLDRQLSELIKKLNITTQAVDSEHFFTKRLDIKNFYENKNHIIMENFYRMMRKKHNILMKNGKPISGQWNFDKSNRKKYINQHPLPETYQFNNPKQGIPELLEKKSVKTIGNFNNGYLQYPINRKQALQALYFFCDNFLVNFGRYQDAMHTDHPFLFHSKISFALNVKLINPKEVIEYVIEYWLDNQKLIEIAQVEGFVRQIIGWREYMRGIYWMHMPHYQNMNFLQNTNSLAHFFWNAKTHMACLRKSIQQSLDYAYAHHIQRLMVTGNFALLTMTNPDIVDNWYLGIYIDALEWVEITNTRGMSQYADGGIVATKPYISSGNYINKMSNYCQSCRYSVTQRVGKKSCPFNALYWNFLTKKRAFFKKNQRMSMMFHLLDKIPKQELTEIQKRADEIIATPDSY